MPRHLDALVLALLGCVVGLLAAPKQALGQLRRPLPALRAPMMPPRAALSFGMRPMLGTFPGGGMMRPGLQSSLANPYLTSGRMNQGMSMNMGSGGSMMSQGGSSGGSATSQGGSSGGSSMGSNPYAEGSHTGADPYGSAAAQAYQQPAYGMIDPSAVLLAYGVPSDHGRLRWPLAFRLMGPQESEAVREPLEALLYMAASGAGQGRIVPWILRDASDNATQLRSWLRDREVGMADVTCQEANDFLRRIEQALAKMGSSY
jgi:hypothetical protein